jgi:hypothetical protein
MKKINCKIKKIITFVIFAIILLSISTSAVNAGIVGDAIVKMNPIKQAYHGSSQEITPAEVVSQIISYVLSFLGVIFLVLLIYGGFLWMTASGDSEQITKAKDILINATIGLIIILSSYTITYFVTQNLTKASGTYY